MARWPPAEIGQQEPRLMSHGSVERSSKCRCEPGYAPSVRRASRKRSELSVSRVANVRNGANGFDDALAVIRGEVDEPNAHPGIPALAQHAHRIDPLDLAEDHERLRCSRWREAKAKPRPDLERLSRAHEDAEL